MYNCCRRVSVRVPGSFQCTAARTTSCPTNSCRLSVRINTTQPGTEEVQAGVHVCSMSQRSLHHHHHRSQSQACCLVNNYPPGRTLDVAQVSRWQSFSKKGTQAILAQGGRPASGLHYCPPCLTTHTTQDMDINTVKIRHNGPKSLSVALLPIL